MSLSRGIPTVEFSQAQVLSEKQLLPGLLGLLLVVCLPSLGQVPWLGHC